MGATSNNGSNFLAPFARKALKEGRFFDGVQAINGCMEAYAKAHTAVNRWFGELWCIRLGFVPGSWNGLVHSTFRNMEWYWNDHHIRYYAAMLLHWSVIWYLLPFLSKRKTTRCQATWSTKRLIPGCIKTRLSRLEAKNWRVEPGWFFSWVVSRIQLLIFNSLNDLPKHSNLVWPTSFGGKIKDVSRSQTLCRSAISISTIQVLGDSSDAVLRDPTAFLTEVQSKLTTEQREMLCKMHLGERVDAWRMARVSNMSF